MALATEAAAAPLLMHTLSNVGSVDSLEGGEIVYRPYVGESDLPSIMALVQSELSEPYVIYTYRYFLQQWCVIFELHSK